MMHRQYHHHYHHHHHHHEQQQNDHHHAGAAIGNRNFRAALDALGVRMPLLPPKPQPQFSSNSPCSYNPSRYTFFLLLTPAQRTFVYVSNFLSSSVFAVLPLIANRKQMQSLWTSLDNETCFIITITVATVFVAQATFTWTFSRIPFMFYNHMQNSRRLHASLLQFAAQVSSAEALDPPHVMTELKLWSARHGQL